MAARPRGCPAAAALTAARQLAYNQASNRCWRCTIAHALVCWRCGASLAALSLPLGRRDECPDCGAELHVCKLCQYYDPAVTKACREDDAEEVKRKERANFCDYFKPSPERYVPGFKAATAGAQEQLAGLFGDDPAAADAPAEGDPLPDPLKDLFKE